MNPINENYPTKYDEMMDLSDKSKYKGSPPAAACSLSLRNELTPEQRRKLVNKSKVGGAG